MHLEHDFSPFGHGLLQEKIFLVTRMNAGQNCFQTVTIFLLFSTACFTYNPAGFGKYF